MTGRRDRRHTRRTVVSLIVTGSLAFSACGPLADRSDPNGSAEPSRVAATPTAISPDATLDQLLPVLLERWRGLDQRVIDGDATGSLASIEEVWALAEPIIRADHQGALFGFQQAVDLARSAVTRTRPADASKGYRLARDLVNDLLER